MSAEVPLFANTGEALAYGLECSLTDFPGLVRTYLATQKALEKVISLDLADLQIRANLAVRLQLLREAIEEFLKAFAAARHAAQGDPARTFETDFVHETAAADPPGSQASSLTRQTGFQPVESDPFLEWHGVEPSDLRPLSSDLCPIPSPS